MFDRLFNAITDIEMNLSLGIENLLIKDFKTYFIVNKGQTGVGLGTVTVPLGLLLQKFTLPNIGIAVKHLMDERNLSYYGILTNYPDKSTGEYKKEVLLFNDSRHQEVDAFDEFVAHLDSHEGFKLNNRVNSFEKNEKVIMW